MHRTPFFVIDANIVIKWFSSIKEKNVREARLIYEAALKKDIQVYVPNIFFIEVLNVFLRSKKLDLQSIEEVFAKLKKLGLRFVQADLQQTSKALHLAHTHSLTIYDALYLALAQEKNCLLITEDTELLKVGERCITVQEWANKYMGS